MTFTNVAMIGLYWLFLSGVVFIAGSLVSRLLVTIPSGAYKCTPGGEGKCLGEKAIQFIAIISAITFLSSIIHLTLHCSVMTGTSLKEVFSVLPLFITKTKYGILSIARTVLLMIIAIILFIGLRHDRIWVTISGVIFSLLLVGTLAMSGHQGTKGYASIPFVLDIFHIIAITVWIGGLFFIRYCYSFFLKEADIELCDIFLKLINRFSNLATISVAIVIVTGVILSILNVESISAVTSTFYGKILLLKVALAGLIMLFGGANKMLLIPRINTIKSLDWCHLISLRRKLDVSMTAEVVLGLAILLATGVLTHLSPGE